MSTICPGQDTRYWRPGDIFDVACGTCGSAVEFFKDDVRRRCASCGAVIQNPKITLGCAQWCEHAKACLGYDPKALASEPVDSSDEGSLIDRLLDALERRLGDDPSELQRALASLEDAKRGLDTSPIEPGEPRSVLVAALLRGLSTLDVSVVEELMEDAGMNRTMIDDVLLQLREERLSS